MNVSKGRGWLIAVSVWGGLGCRGEEPQPVARPKVEASAVTSPAVKVEEGAPKKELVRATERRERAKPPLPFDEVHDAVSNYRKLLGSLARAGGDEAATVAVFKAFGGALGDRAVHALGALLKNAELREKLERGYPEELAELRGVLEAGVSAAAQARAASEDVAQLSASLLPDQAVSLLRSVLGLPEPDEEVK